MDDTIERLVWFPDQAENDIPEWKRDSEFSGSEQLLTKAADTLFHIGQSYEKRAAPTMVCNQCGGNAFHVGHDKYYTAIKCVICQWEMRIHDG